MSPIKFHPQSKFLPVIKLEFLQKPGGLARFPYSVLLAVLSVLHRYDAEQDSSKPREKRKKKRNVKRQLGQASLDPLNMSPGQPKWHRAPW